MVVFDAPQDGRRPVWLCGLGADRSWACVLFCQYVEHRLWAEAERAHAWWRGHGEPGLGQLGLIVDHHRQYAWLHVPGEPLPVFTARP